MIGVLVVCVRSYSNREARVTWRMCIFTCVKQQRSARVYTRITCGDHESCGLKHEHGTTFSLATRVTRKLTLCPKEK